MSATIDDAESKKDFSTCFIHSALDDYGLTPAQFRVLCRIARRGDCTESAKNIARGCRMNEDTVWSAIKFLVENSVINKAVRTGHTSTLTINPFSQWKQPGGKEGTPEKRGHLPKSATGQRKIGDTHPAEKRGHKGNPLEGNPIKGINPPPLPSQLPGLIKGQKELIDRTPFDDPRQDAFHEKLFELETLLYGAPKSIWKTAPIISAGGKKPSQPLSPEKAKELWEKAKAEHKSNDNTTRKS